MAPHVNEINTADITEGAKHPAQRMETSPWQQALFVAGCEAIAGC